MQDLKKNNKLLQALIEKQVRIFYCICSLLFQSYGYTEKFLFSAWTAMETCEEQFWKLFWILVTPTLLKDGRTLICNPVFDVTRILYVMVRNDLRMARYFIGSRVPLSVIGF